MDSMSNQTTASGRDFAAIPGYQDTRAPEYLGSPSKRLARDFVAQTEKRMGNGESGQTGRFCGRFVVYAGL